MHAQFVPLDSGPGPAGRPGMTVSFSNQLLLQIVRERAQLRQERLDHGFGRAAFAVNPDIERSDRLAIAPAQGEVRATTTALPVHSHPDPAAPVILRLEPGQSLPRRGAVEGLEGRWAAVLLFSDGSPAFVPDAAPEEAGDPSED